MQVGERESGREILNREEEEEGVSVDGREVAPHVVLHECRLLKADFWTLYSLYLTISMTSSLTDSL